MADTERKQATLTDERALKLLTSTWRRTHQLRDHIRDYNRLHFYNDPKMNPELEEPLDHVKYQTDIPRRKHEELKARLIENHGVVHVTPATEGKNDKAVEDAEAVLNAWWHICEERLGYWLQDGLSDGQIVDAYAVLHWREWEEVWPEVPEYEYMDALPEDDDEDDEKDRERKNRIRERFESEPDEDGKHRETDKSLQERVKRARARVGFPYYIEVVDPLSFSFARDVLTNIGMAVTVKRLGLAEYNESIADYGQVVADSEKLRFYPADAPDTNDVSHIDYSSVTVATLWTRDEWYEFATLKDYVTEHMTDASGGEWELVKSGKHRWGRPPFEIVPANLFNTSEPLNRYMPVLEGVYREKPKFDRYAAILEGLAERHAIPDMWWEMSNSGTPQLNEDGGEVALGKNSQDAGMAPAGYALRQNNVQLNPAYIEAWHAKREDLNEAAPSIGQAEISASTQPWTARLAQAQASVKPRDLIQKQMHALRAMWRSILQHAADREETLWAYKRDLNGREENNIVGLDPEDIVTLNVDVDINSVTAAEEITLVQHGMQMLNDPLVPLTKRKFVEDYWGQPNALDLIAAYDAEQLVETQIKPGLIAQKMAEKYGSRYVVGPNGVMAGMDGQPADPEQMMQERGFKPQQPGQQGPGRQAPGMSNNPNPGGSPGNQVSMPALRGAPNPRGSMPMPPVEGTAPLP